MYFGKDMFGCQDDNYPVPFFNTFYFPRCRKRDMLKVERAIAYLNDDIQTDGRSNTESYDVFLSYSHCNLAEAKQFLTTLQQADPTLKVFFDYDELKTGEDVNKFQQCQRHLPI